MKKISVIAEINIAGELSGVSRCIRTIVTIRNARVANEISLCIVRMKTLSGLPDRLNQSPEIMIKTKKTPAIKILFVI